MRRYGGILLVAVATFATPTLPGQSGQSRPAGSTQSHGSRAAKPDTTSHAYQSGSHSPQFSALNQINNNNVTQLQEAWTFPVTGNIVFNPLVVEGVMYLQGPQNAIVALDAGTGKEIWR